MISPLALSLILAAGPAATQTSSCVRDGTGALQCAMSSLPSLPNATRRPVSTRELSAAALARSKAQAQAMRESMDQQRKEAEVREWQRRSLVCPTALHPSSSSEAAPGASCRP